MRFFLPLLLAFTLLAGALAQDGGDALLERVRFGRFVTSDNCALCHSNASPAGALRDNQGRPVAPYDLWRASMMANAARDPFFLAAMAAETAHNPSRRKDIEAKCLRCHAPMAHDEVRRRSGKDSIGVDVFRLRSPFRALALDGVSCTVCHQIQPRNLGKPESWGGEFETDNGREIYGPHDDVFGLPMQNVLTYYPTKGDHIRDSGLCATCHTLFVGTLDESGAPTGHSFPEQTPYLEWRNSIYAREGAEKRTCQDCHVPTQSRTGARIKTRIAREVNGSDFHEIEAREPFGRHLFVGPTH